MKTAALALVALVPVALALHGPRTSVNLWRLKQARVAAAKNERLEAAPAFVAQTFTQPLDHNVKNSPTWQQRFWVSTRHYNPAHTGPVPVFVLDGGETGGDERLPFLDTGVIDQLARATGGVGVVLEHRYYGESIPVQNFTTDSMRWLNNEQALADSANFMRNVKFANVTRKLTAPDTPWIYYGGSYAGARSALMAVAYPDIVYGAIASSGVTEAIIDMWQYMDAIRLAANQTCMTALAASIKTIDTILEKNNTADTQALKTMFGLEGVVHTDDFATSLTGFLDYWQDKNWDPTVDDGSSAAFDDVCDQLLAPGNGSTHASIGGVKISQTLVNYGRYMTEYVSEVCPPPYTVDECFTTYDDSGAQATDLSQTWRPWDFQTCTQWGFWLTAPPSDSTPRIVSRYNTVPYISKFCQQAFPPGKVYSIPAQPDVASVNKYGGFAIARDRLAFIDGEKDPWRPATVHSPYGAHARKSTTERPYILIPGAVHHWDENGLVNGTGEPAEIKQVHSQEIAFVKQWLSEWKAPGSH